MSKKRFVYYIAAIYSLISPILFIFCASELNYIFGDNRKVYFGLLILLTMLLLGLNGLVMGMAARIPEGQEKTGCLLLVTAIIGFFSIMFWVGFFGS